MRRCENMSQAIAVLGTGCWVCKVVALAGDGEAYAQFNGHVPAGCPLFQHGTFGYTGQQVREAAAKDRVLMTSTSRNPESWGCPTCQAPWMWPVHTFSADSMECKRFYGNVLTGVVGLVAYLNERLIVEEAPRPSEDWDRFVKWCTQVPEEAAPVGWRNGHVVFEALLPKMGLNLLPERHLDE